MFPTKRGNEPFLRIINCTKKGWLPAYEGDGVNISSRMSLGQRGNVQGGVSLTLKTSIDVGVVVEVDDEADSDMG